MTFSLVFLLISRGVKQLNQARIVSLLIIRRAVKQLNRAARAFRLIFLPNYALIIIYKPFIILVFFLHRISEFFFLII